MREVCGSSPIKSAFSHIYLAFVLCAMQKQQPENKRHISLPNPKETNITTQLSLKMRLQQQNISTVNFHTYILFLQDICAVWEMDIIEKCICMARKSQQMCASGTLKTQSYICQHLILIVLLDCDQTRHIMISDKSHLFHVSLSFRL